jgi:hypothetical protein
MKRKSKRNYDEQMQQQVSRRRKLEGWGRVTREEE